MRVPMEWLREYVDVAMAPEELAVRLTMLGFEVKGVESGERPGTAWSWGASCRWSGIPTPRPCG